MGLINFLRGDKPNEIKYLKKTNSLENQITLLENYRENLNEAGQQIIDEDIKCLKYGLKGETNIQYELETSYIPMYILQDVFFEYKGVTAQIDYIVITPYKTFLIEAKNLYGDVEIDNNGNFSRIIKNGDKINRIAIKNPISQSERHINLIKSMKKDDMSLSLKNYFENKNFNDNYDFVVVLTNPNTYLNSKFAKKDVKNKVVRLDRLNDYIKKSNKASGLIEKTDSNMFEEAQYFLSKNIEERKEYLKKYESYLLTDEEKKTLELNREKVLLEEKEKNSFDELFNQSSKKDTIEDFINAVNDTKVFTKLENSSFFNQTTDDYEINIFRAIKEEDHGYIFSIMNLMSINSNMKIGRVILTLLDFRKSPIIQKQLNPFKSEEIQSKFVNQTLSCYLPFEKKTDKPYYFILDSEFSKEELGLDHLLCLKLNDNIFSITDEFNIINEEITPISNEITPTAIDSNTPSNYINTSPEIIKESHIIEKQIVIMTKEHSNEHSNLLQTSGEIIDYDSMIRQEISEWRKKEAYKQNVPAYYIFNNQTLEELIQKKPKYKDELFRISGLGRVKIDKYGDSLISIINKGSY